MTSAASRSTILLVEDNPGDARLILEMIRDIPAALFEFEQVDRLDAALDRLGRSGVDLVLLDLGLPDSSGIDTFRRAQDRAPAQPIVVISGLDDEQVALEAVRAGAQDYLVKGRIEGHLLARVMRYAIERKRSEREARNTAARLKALMDHASDGISVLSPDGTILEVNRRMAEIIGRDTDEIVGQHFGRFLPPADVARRQDQFDASTTGGAAEVLGVEISRPDGSIVVVDFSTSTVEVGGEVVALSIGRDVTKHRQLERMYQHAQKMEAVGRLAGGIAHDFNNLLTVITSFTDLLLMDLPPDYPKRAEIELIQKAALGAAALTRQLLTFTRQQVIQPRVLDIRTSVKSAESLLRPILGEDIRITIQAAAALGMVRIDPGHLEQVIINLAVNARDAMPQGGQLTIETENRELEASELYGFQLATPGHYVMLSVSDTGTGMDEQTQARIFEPFFTTKGVGKGTGLGLATAYEIVHQAGGIIRVYSEVGQGTSFRIYLPRVDEPAPDAAIPLAREPARGTETVLVVDDEAALRAATRQVLQRFGYHVLEAPDGRTALQMADLFDGPIHLLLTDVVMPGLSGREVAERVTASRPATKVLFVSGYTDGSVVNHGVLEAGLHYLQKPFSVNSLGHKVREVLDS